MEDTIEIENAVSNLSTALEQAAKVIVPRLVETAKLTSTLKDIEKELIVINDKLTTLTTDVDSIKKDYRYPLG